MMKRGARVLELACAVCLLGPAVLVADFYDCFNDGAYYDPNYWEDPCDWGTFDPNYWDIDNPCWGFYEGLGNPYEAIVDNGCLRIWSDVYLFPWTVVLAGVDDHNYDPDVSKTYWDDAVTHYVLTQVKNTNEEPDPERGRALLVLHASELTWLAYEFQYGFMDYGSGTTLIGLSLIDGFDWKNIAFVHGMSKLDEIGGFWMLFQFESDGVTGDPNGKFLRATCWNGGKYDWNGTWLLTADLGGDPNNFVDPRAADSYQSKGRTALGIWSDTIYEAGPPCDVSFDNIEIRTGAFTNLSRTLSLTIKTADKGTVTIDPDLLDDPNHASMDPNVATDPNELRRYTDGTEIVLVAYPAEGRSFKAWKLFDPNHPGDANYITQDSNTVLYLTMDADYEVQAVFKCGSGSAPLLPAILCALGLLGLERRRS